MNNYLIYKVIHFFVTVKVIKRHPGQYFVHIYGNDQVQPPSVNTIRDRKLVCLRPECDEAFACLKMCKYKS